MKRTLILSITLLFTVALSYGQQTISSENISEFNAISLNGNISAQLIKSDTNKIDIILTDVDINKFKWNLKSGTLNVDLNSGPRGKGHADVKIHYAGPINAISVSGGELITPEVIESNMLRFSVNGGAKVTAKFEVMDLDANITGNSVVLLSGSAKYLTMHAGERSKVDVRPMECVSADVDASSGAEVYLFVTERLVANAKTTSTIFYKGKPSILKDKTSKMNSNVMGSGILNIGD